MLPRDTVRVGQPTADRARSQRPRARQPERPISSGGAPQQDTVVFNPLRTFKRSEDMELYYEVEGLSAGTAYTVRIAVRKQGGGGGLVQERCSAAARRQISLKFDEQAASFPVTSTSRSLKLDKPQAGELRAWRSR